MKRGTLPFAVALAIGGEGEQLAVGSPSRVDEVALVGNVELGGVGAVGVHLIELGNSATIADEDNGVAGLRIPSRGSAGAVGKSEALGAAAAGVADEEFGIAEHRRGKHQAGTIG